MNSILKQKKEIFLLVKGIMSVLMEIVIKMKESFFIKNKTGSQITA